jgi:hypothetical protein
MGGESASTFNLLKGAYMKAFTLAIVLGIGFLMVSGNPARAQVGDTGDAVKKDAGDAVKQEIMNAGLPMPGTAGAAPAADTGAASAPVGEPKVAPGAAKPPAAGSNAGVADAPVDQP